MDKFGFFCASIFMCWSHAACARQHVVCFISLSAYLQFHLASATRIIMLLVVFSDLIFCFVHFLHSFLFSRRWVFVFFFLAMWTLVCVQGLSFFSKGSPVTVFVRVVVAVIARQKIFSLSGSPWLHTLHYCSLFISRFQYHSDFIVWVFFSFTTFTRPLVRLLTKGLPPPGGSGVTCPLPFIYWVFHEVAVVFVSSFWSVLILFFLCVDPVSVCCVSCRCGFTCAFWDSVWSLFFLAHLALSSTIVAILPWEH